MRITKTMKEVIEKRLYAKEQEADDAARAGYRARKNSCADELRAMISECRAKVNDVLVEYGMDTIDYDYMDRPSGNAADSIFRFDDSHIHNNAERKELDAASRQRHTKMKDAVEEIIFDAEAGGNKESLLAAIAAVTFD